MKRSFECTCSYDQDLQTEKAAGVYFHRVPSPPMLPTVEEAQRFYNELEERAQKFGLELARDKHGSSGSPISSGRDELRVSGFEFSLGCESQRSCMAPATHRTKEVTQLTETRN